MTGQGHFTTPQQLTVGDITASTSVDEHNERPNMTCHTPQGDFVPLELWTPPTLLGKPRLKGLVGLEPYPKFKRYRLADEFASYPEWTDDHSKAKDRVATSMKSLACFLIEVLGAAIPPGSADGHILTTGDATVNAEPSNADIGLPGAISDGMTGLGDDPYNCGWDDLMDDGIIPSLESGGDNLMITDPKVPSDIYGCGLDDGNTLPVLLCTGKPTDDPYGCRWDDPRAAETALPGTFPDCQMNNQMDDPVVIAEGNLTFTGEQTMNAFEQAEHSMHHAVWKLNDLGHTNYENWIQNHVTLSHEQVAELGEYVADLHHLLNLHCHIMGPLNSIISEIEKSAER
ncbi:hypothetical protein BDR05DRAFT_1005147 [Suillus weaverae]|nr:hypothetical protein BDR05DRAFT_1005147 [Suillus weaverae]